MDVAEPALAATQKPPTGTHRQVARKRSARSLAEAFADTPPPKRTVSKATPKSKAPPSQKLEAFFKKTVAEKVAEVATAAPKETVAEKVVETAENASEDVPSPRGLEGARVVEKGVLEAVPPPARVVEEGAHEPEIIFAHSDMEDIDGTPTEPYYRMWRSLADESWAITTGQRELSADMQKMLAGTPAHAHSCARACLPARNSACARLASGWESAWSRAGGRCVHSS